MEDLIRRSDAIDAVRVAYFDKDIQSAKDDPCIVDAMTDWAIRQIKSLSSADRPQGEWIYGEHNVAMCDGYRCNRCDFFVPWDYEHKFIDFINDYHFCPNCGARMKGADDETEIQNSNLTFEKVMEEIQTQVIEFPDTHQKFIFARKIETDGDSIKICGWEYKGVKDED